MGLVAKGAVVWEGQSMHHNALCFALWDKRDPGSHFHLGWSEEYGGEVVDSAVVDVPFRPSVNPNAREVVKEHGSDFAC